MKKAIIVIVPAVSIIAAGSFLLFYKPPKATGSSSASSTTSQGQAGTVNNAVLTTRTVTSIGDYLADPSGKTLYTSASDTSGVSNCNGSCLTAWPPYLDTGSTSGLPTGISTIKRTDTGGIQYTYNGMPLYYFTSDSQGQVTGDGVSNFQVAKPSSASTSPSTTTPPASSPSTSPSNNSSPGYSY
jgi:predicted lipoprotein with Yx(FWY)xxD motif